MKQTFIKGLKLKIQAEISRDTLIGLRAIMNATLSAEFKLNTTWQAWNEVNGEGGTAYQGVQQSLWSSAKDSYTTRRLSLIHHNNDEESDPYKLHNEPQEEQKRPDNYQPESIKNKRRIMLTEAELQVPRKKRLCYHYNENFGLGHSYKKFL